MMNKPKIGIQLYSVRETLQNDFKGTLQALRGMGFQGVELAFNYGDMEPDELAGMIKELNLTVCGIYDHFPNLQDESSIVYKYADALGCKYLTSGFSLQPLQEDFNGCVNTSKQACDIAESKDLKICYHAHSHEFQKMDEESYLDKLLEAVPQMLFEADTAWIKQGGEDVIGYMEKHANRIPLLHVKDVKEDGEITELGNGVIDFKPVIDFANTADIEWISYEQDSTKLTPLESAQISIDHLKNL